MTIHRMTIIHRVPDVAAWRSVLERTGSHPGLLRRSVFRSIDDPNEVMIELEFESAESATGYLPSLPVRELRQELGLDVYPPVFIGTELTDPGVDR
jgi:hypothetical protein